jgi:hypothetical protein
MASFERYVEMAEQREDQPQEPSERPLNEREEKVVAKCEQLRKHFNAVADDSKRLFKRLQYPAVVLSVAVASIAAVEAVPRWVVAAIGGLAALCAGLLTAIRPHEVWLQSRRTEQQLITEQFLFNQCAGQYSLGDKDARVRLFAERVMAIWETGHTQWEQGRYSAGKQTVGTPP